VEVTELEVATAVILARLICFHWHLKWKWDRFQRNYHPWLYLPELLAYEQAKLVAESLKVDQHVNDLLELFENPNSESVPPVLKKAWPSISR
jgi:hypothetical protein